ncbi:MAG: hypothetical protein DSZ27_02150 [Thiomicrospira sp.]|nr:MAG: hypothetical protein DSZ27_02150 [Thiomicrospira sp.]
MNRMVGLLFITGYIFVFSKIISRQLKELKPNREMKSPCLMNRAASKGRKVTIFLKKGLSERKNSL